MLWRGLAGLGLGALLCMAGGGSMVPPQQEVWGQPAVSLPLTADSRVSGKINLAGARNEHLFFPVVIEGGSASLQAGVEGRADALQCNVFRVVTVPPATSETYPPDALLPFEEDYPEPDSGSFLLWVSLKITPTCPPGLYPLNLVITDRGKSIRLPVELKVFRFALPEDLPITIFAGFWHQPGFWPQYGEDGRGSEVRIIKSYYQSLREYKVNALGGSYPLPLDQIQPGQRMEDFSTYHELFRYALNELNFAYCQIPKLKGWQSVSRPQSSFVRQARVFYPCYANYLRRHGWENRALNYLVDEPGKHQYQAVVQAYARAQSLLPQVKSLCAGWDPRPEFARVIDIWTHQAAHFREDDLERAQRQGQEAWLYANRLHTIGCPLTHPRLIGWLLYSYQFSGYLLWGVNYWPRNPWTTPPGPQDFYRRGTFYYPHPETGHPIPTTRLEALRRGFQDYQYFLLLDQACRRGLIPREEQTAIQAQIRRFTQDLPGSSFPVSMAEMEAVRLRIGHLLDRMEELPKSLGKMTGPRWFEGGGFQTDRPWEVT